MPSIPAGSLNIPRHRLGNQRITGAGLKSPAEVVSWMGAIQAQDYLGALWGVGLRMRNGTEAALEEGLASGSIVRTWPMRGTLHFVAAADVRWMLRLMTPRILSRNAPRLQRQFGIDGAAIGRSRDLFIAALEGGKRISREGMYRVLETGGISAAGQRGLHILWWLAQEGLICFGPRQGKQQTFVLLDEWAPENRAMEREESLAELARRYFTARGPATMQDFAWWSGLTLADVRAGADMAKPHLIQETINGENYWLAPSRPAAMPPSPALWLLPAFDEYTVANRDRSALLKPEHAGLAGTRNGILNPVIVLDGEVVGTWKRTLGKNGVIVTPQLFDGPLSIDQEGGLAAAVERYGRFLGLPALLAGS
jgi:hypothetical protein